MISVNIVVLTNDQWSMLHKYHYQSTDQQYNLTHSLLNKHIGQNLCLKLKKTSVKQLIVNKLKVNNKTY